MRLKKIDERGFFWTLWVGGEGAGAFPLSNPYRTDERYRSEDTTDIEWAKYGRRGAAGGGAIKGVAVTTNGTRGGGRGVKVDLMRSNNFIERSGFLRALFCGWNGRGVERCIRCMTGWGRRRFAGKKGEG